MEEKNQEKISVVLNTNNTLANALRRTVLEVPVLAIEDVEIHKNDSILYDEVLALRLGLLPLITPDEMNLKEECSCKGKGCSKCSAELKLNSKGPKIVLAEELSGKVKCAYPKMPIVEIKEEQEIVLLAKAIIGQGINHTKFTPGLVYYTHETEIEKIKKQDIKDENIVEVDEEDFNEILENKTQKVYDFVGDVVKFQEDYIYVKPNKEKIKVFIESWGQIPPKKIFLSSIKILKKNLKELAK
jgi:DNA-directed RNA polymerase subunit D